MPIKVAVIGAGVNGLSTAVQMVEQLGDKVNVTVLSDHFTPYTTGDGSAGLWGPYLCGSTSEAKLIEWGSISHMYMHDMWKSGRAEEVGICLIPTIRYTDEPGPFNAFWQNIVFGFERLTQADIDTANVDHSAKYTSGVRFVTFTCEPTKWLPYLMRQFTAAGGHLMRRRVENFEELASENYDLIINCAGLNGGQIANDRDAIPIRGQVMKVDASWQFHVHIDDGSIGYYIIPNMNQVVLGGTHQEGDYNLTVDPVDSEFIRSTCGRIVKPMKNAKIYTEWVGLRPGRNSVRVAQDTYVTNSKRKLDVIHNYGHGGCGVSLAWGCASDVLGLVRKTDAWQKCISSKL